MIKYRNNMTIDPTAFVKGGVATMVMTIINFYSPIEHFWYVIMGLSTINIFCGWLADEGRRWSFKKAITALNHVAVYIMILAGAYTIGHFMQQSDQHVIAFTSWVTWVIVYFYSSNILRNLKVIFPGNKVISFLYWVVTVEFISKINYLKQYKEEEDNNG